MRFVIQGRLPSWNFFYKSVHWSKRSSVAHLWHMLVREALDKVPDNERIKMASSVHIAIHAFYTGLGADPDNVCAKLVIDGLKGTVIGDDSANFVRSVTTTSTSQHKEDRVEVVVTEVGHGAAE